MKVRANFGQHPSIREGINAEKKLVLEFDDAGPGAQGYWRYEVLESIQLLLMGSYAFNLNPLPDLRKFFPNFEWKFQDLSDFDETSDVKGWKAALKKLVTESDFFWKIHGGCNDMWVFATRKDKTPERLHIFGSGTIDEVLSIDRSLAEFLKKECGAQNDPFYVAHGWKADHLRTFVERPEKP